MIQAQRKGKVFERLVARTLGVRRGLQGLGRERLPDVDLPGWWVECKRRRKPNIPRAYLQAIEDATGTGREPCAITKADNGPILVTVSLDALRQLLACDPFRVGSSSCCAPKRRVGP